MMTDAERPGQDDTNRKGNSGDELPERPSFLPYYLKMRIRLEQQDQSLEEIPLGLVCVDKVVFAVIVEVPE